MNKITTSVKTSDCSSESRVLEIPDRCPICHTAISPRLLISIADNVFFTNANNNISSAAICPACHKLFYIANKPKNSAGICELIECGPETPNIREFPNEMDTVSPSFIEIFQQAQAAEAYRLNEIAGIGYRKALEFLIKDYAIMTHPDKVDFIKKSKLSVCINSYIDHDKIKSTATAAAWIGNDETHYIRKWEDKDITDLKRFIDTCVYWILADYNASDAAAMVSDGKRSS